MKRSRTNFILTDEIHDSIKHLLFLRVPWLMLGLMGGVGASFIVSRFEHVLSSDIRLAFFLPVIVYMSDAVGTQTETLYVRSLGNMKSSFFKYLWKEFCLGIVMGILLGFGIAATAYIWLKSVPIALTVGFAMFCNVCIAPFISLIIAQILYREHTDPALGAGPFTTVVQDVVSLLVYFAVAALIIYNHALFA